MEFIFRLKKRCPSPKSTRYQTLSEGIPPQHAVHDHPTTNGILLPHSKTHPKARHRIVLATSVKKVETPVSTEIPKPSNAATTRVAMIQLLFTVLAAEAGVAVALFFKTPLRKLAMLAVDRLKRGRGPVMVRTVAATVLVVLASSVHSMAKIRGRAAADLDAAGGLTPTDQVLLARHLLEASLMGYSLFLALVIDRLHNYIREIRGLKKNLEAVSKQNKTLEEAKHGRSNESKPYQEDIASLNEEIKKLKLQLKEKAEEAKNAEAKALAAQKQSEGQSLRYDRLLEDNKHLRDQLQSADSTLSRSDGKKNT